MRSNLIYPPLPFYTEFQISNHCKDQNDPTILKLTGQVPYIFLVQDILYFQYQLMPNKARLLVKIILFDIHLFIFSILLLILPQLLLSLRILYILMGRILLQLHMDRLIVQYLLQFCIILNIQMELDYLII
jgi:hypothetical protein